MDISINQKFPWKTAICLYFPAFGLMLLFPNAYFWDDWSSKLVSPALEVSYWREQGFPPWDYFVPITLFGRSPMLIRTATFIIFFVCAILVHRILKYAAFVEVNLRRIITLLFLVLPINSARVSLDNFHYSFALFMFFMGWCLLVSGQSKWTRMSSIVFFLISFSVLSFLVFFLAPVLHLYSLELKRPNANRFSSAIQPAIFLALAPTYWIFTKIQFPPKAELQDYYLPQLSGVIRGLTLLCMSGLFLERAVRRSSVSNVNPRTTIAVGLFMLALGSAPYISSGRLVDLSEWMLNFVPSQSDWDSRHQLLLGLGFALAIAGSLQAIGLPNSRPFQNLVLASCVLLNFTFMHGYWLDSIKQSELIEQFSKSEQLQSGKFVMFDDLTTRFNARGREYRSYEWNGIMSKSFGDDTRKYVKFSYIDCKNNSLEQPDLLVTIFANRGRFLSTLTGAIGIGITVETVAPCTIHQ